MVDVERGKCRFSGRYGNPVLVWRRPGGTDSALNESGVVCRPQHTVELRRRERTKKQRRAATARLRNREVKVASQEVDLFGGKVCTA